MFNNKENYIEDMFTYRKQKVKFIEGTIHDTFNLYLDPERYYKVKVFKSLKQMRKYDNDFGIFGACSHYIKNIHEEGFIK